MNNSTSSPSLLFDVARWARLVMVEVQVQLLKAQPLPDEQKGQRAREREYHMKGRE